MKVETNELTFTPVMGAVEVTFRSRDLVFNEDLTSKWSNDTFVVEIKRKRKNRSLDANNYAWTLCDKIARHKDILSTKDEIYRGAIRDYGVSAVMPIQDEKLKDICKWHEMGGLGNQTRIYGRSKFDGYTNVIFYYGSSGYDSLQMSKLIDGVVSDCHDLGIETLTPLEIARLKDEWGNVK